jgi:hypothetical protein
MNVETHEMIFKIGPMSNAETGVTSGPETDAILNQYLAAGWRIVYEDVVGFENGVVVKSYRVEHDMIPMAQPAIAESAEVTA